VKTRDKTLGSVIATIRSQAPISQEALAERAGVHRTYISQLERNLKSPTVETLKRLARALGVKASYLVRLTEDDADEL